MEVDTRMSVGDESGDPERVRELETRSARVCVYVCLECFLQVTLHV